MAKTAPSGSSRFLAIAIIAFALLGIGAKIYIKTTQASSDASNSSSTNDDRSDEDLLVGEWVCTGEKEVDLEDGGSAVIRHTYHDTSEPDGRYEGEVDMKFDYSFGSTGHVRLWTTGRQWISDGRLCATYEITRAVGLDEIGEKVAEAFPRHGSVSDQGECDAITFSESGTFYILTDEDFDQTTCRRH